MGNHCRFLCILICSLFSVSLFAQSPAKIVFETKVINLGDIHYAKGLEYDLSFNFKNEGGTPLVIYDLKVSCGCTKPKYPATPIKQGKEGVINVKFSLNGIEGYFSKNVVVKSNAENEIVVLRIKGNIK